MHFLHSQGKFNFGVYPKSEAFNPFQQVFLPSLSSTKKSNQEEADCSQTVKESLAEKLNSSSPSPSSSKLLPSPSLSKLKRFTGNFSTYQRLKTQQQHKLQRKVAPYFQSISDIEYTIVKHRTDLILAEIFKHKGGVNYIEKNSAYHNPKVFVPSRGKDGYGVWAGAGTGRYSENLFDRIQNNYVSGYNIQNA